MNPGTSPPSAESGGFAAGQKVGQGRFTLVRFLGKGGMGIVWLAEDSRLRQQVALKFLPTEIRADPDALDDMRRETVRSIKLSHPHIIRIHDLHEYPDELFIAMEFVEGSTLSAFKREQPQRFVSWERLRPLLRQLCDALDYAHGENVIHRDLKPANMMLDARGRLKLADFGIAAVLSDSLSRVSVKHTTSGTLAYMSPQQMNGQKPLPTDDIYALGATIYELLTSKPPFHQGDLINQVQNIMPPPMMERLADLELTNDIPADVQALVMACLSKDPALRPQSARAMAEWIGLEPGSEKKSGLLEAVSPAGKDAAGERVLVENEVEAAPVESGKGRKLALWGGLTVMLLATLVGAWWWMKNTPSTRGQQEASRTRAAATPSCYLSTGPRRIRKVGEVSRVSGRNQHLQSRSFTG